MIRRIVIASIVSAFMHASLWADSKQMDLKWDSLGAQVGQSKVALVLPTGTYIEGRVLQVEPNGLRLRVSKTSDRKTLAKGEHLIPRQSVTTLQVIQYRTIARIACTLGAAAATAAIVVAAGSDVTEGPVAIIAPASAAAGAVGAGIGGYYLGKRLDKKVTEIRIVP